MFLGTLRYVGCFFYYLVVYFFRKEKLGMDKSVYVISIVLKFIGLTLFILIVSFLIIFFLLVLFLWIIHNPGDDIYDDTHYYCGDNYEIYIASAGATDKYHYYIKSEIEILLFGNFKIVYTKEDERTKEDYDYILKNYECSLAGENDG